MTSQARSLEIPRESSSSSRGLRDYTRDRATIRRHRFVKKVVISANTNSSGDEEPSGKLTLQELRQCYSKVYDDDDDRVIFQIRRSLKRRRDGSARSLSERSMALYRGEGKSREEPIAKGVAVLRGETTQASHETLSEGILEELWLQPGVPSLVGSSHSSQGLQAGSTHSKGAKGSLDTGPLTDEESNASEPSYTSGSLSDSTQSAPQVARARAPQNTPLNRSVAVSPVTQSRGGNTTIPNHLQPCESVDKDESDEDEVVIVTPQWKSNLGSYSNMVLLQSPSDSDESFTSFAQKYSRFAHNVVDLRALPVSDRDSTMDLHESFSSFASFADDDDYGGDNPLGNSLSSLLDQSHDINDILGGESEEEDELSVSVQSPDSVVVDLTSVSSSVNSQSQSPKSATKYVRSASRRSLFETPLNEIAPRTSRNQNETAIQTSQKKSRFRNEAGGDDASTGSVISKHSARSTGSWLSRRSTRSTSSRFSRLEEYLKKNDSERKSKKSARSKASEESLSDKLEDRSAVSALSDMSLSLDEKPKEQPKAASRAKSMDAVTKASCESLESESTRREAKPAKSLVEGINANPFLAADLRNNVALQNAPGQSKNVVGKHTWQRNVSPEEAFVQSDSPDKSESVKVESPKRTLAKLGVGRPKKTETSFESPQRSPGRLNFKHLSSFSGGNDKMSNKIRAAPSPSKSAQFSPTKRSSPRRAASSDAVLESLRQLASELNLTSPRKGGKKSTTDPSRCVLKHGTAYSTADQKKTVSKLWKKSPSSPPLIVGVKKPSEQQEQTSRVAASVNSSQYVDPVSRSTTKTVNTAVKAPGSPGKVSKAKSYQQKFDKTSPSTPSCDLQRVSLSPKKWSPPKKTAAKKVCDEGQLHNMKAPEKPLYSPVGRKVETSWPPPSPVTSSPKKEMKPLAMYPGHSPGVSHKSLRNSTRIGSFLQSFEKEKHDEEYFDEPAMSPWQPSKKSGRVRRRPSLGRSVASSRASSRASVTEPLTPSSRHRAGSHLSMFQPHQQVPVDCLPSNESPRSRRSSIDSKTEENSLSGSVRTPKMSLVEQRKRMFQHR